MKILENLRALLLRISFVENGGSGVPDIHKNFSLKGDRLYNWEQIYHHAWGRATVEIYNSRRSICPKLLL
jgi:hypothetical protein